LPIPSTRILVYVLAVLGITFIGVLFGLGRNQIIATAVFSGLIAGALLFWRFRLAFAFVGIATMLGLGLLDVPTLINFAGLDIILFLVGMMIVVGYLEENRFFEYLIERIIRFTGANGRRLVIVLMMMAGFSAALVDEVTSILFMTATVLNLTARYRVNPFPFVIMMVFATNVGSSATVVGNPVGVMIALRGELSFSDFLRWATPISIAVLFGTIALCLRYFKAPITELSFKMRRTPLAELEPEETTFMLAPPVGFRRSVTLFVLTVLGLVFHRQLEEVLRLERNSMLIGTALLGAGVALLLEYQKARELVERRVDWWTLSFFLILFASVGTLEFVGVSGLLATGLLSVTSGEPTLLFLLFSGVVGILSAVMDNVLAVATFIPVVNDLRALAVPTFLLWWGLLFGGTLVGRLTPIGSTANIVAVGVLERQRNQHITLRQWIRPGAYVTFPTYALALALLYLQAPLMPP
jgi:Na+/H+ antiporter NhaD/arsenite permease-like protein